MKSKSHQEDALSVVRRLRQAGHVAYFAGGCVRDLLLGNIPKDYDVATDAPPARVKDLFFHSQSVGAAFGVILVRAGRTMVEVATFRSDGRYFDGRRPTEVRFTTAQEDARRRDFTINGLFFDPLTDTVIDFVGGRDDLSHRVVRAIGDPAARFGEDSLRVLRAVRFAARFGFAIEPGTFRAIASHGNQLRRISPERIAEELRMMLSPVTRSAAWRLLWELGLIHVIFRLLPTAGRDQPLPERFLFECVSPQASISFPLALAAAVTCYWLVTRPRLVDPRPMFLREEVLVAVHAVRQSLKISNDETEEFRETLLGVGIMLSESALSTATQKRFLARPNALSSRELLNALATKGILREIIESRLANLNELEKTPFAPAPFVTGDDLGRLGLEPGPAYKRILDAVYDAQLEDQVCTKTEALAMSLRLANNGF